MNDTVFGNRVFANGQIKMRSLEWALNQSDWCLYKKGNLDTETYPCRETVEVGVMQIQVKELLRLSTNHQKLGGEGGDRFSLSSS